MSHSKRSDGANLLHDIAVWEENIKRENKLYRPHETFRITPTFKKNFIMTVKPNTQDFDKNAQKDSEYVQISTRSMQSPKEKLKAPILTSQEYGWDPQPLMPQIKDMRFYRPKTSSEITKMYSLPAKRDPPEPPG